jgi:hypothetical protein
VTLPGPLLAFKQVTNSVLLGTRVEHDLGYFDSERGPGRTRP